MPHSLDGSSMEGCTDERRGQAIRVQGAGALPGRARAEDHKRFVGLSLHKPAEVLFAFDRDGSPMVGAARRAGEQRGIEVVGRDVAGVADYLYNAALRLSP